MDLAQHFDLLPSAVFTVDSEGRVTSWNRRAESITGYSSNEILGQSCFVFADHPCKDKCGLFDPDIEKPLTGRICTILTKDGETRQIRKNADVLRDGEGNITGGIETFEDITDVRQAENKLQASENRYRLLVENANSIILRWNRHGHITLFNEFAETVFGFNRCEILGKHVIGTIVPETESTGRNLKPLMEDIHANPEKHTYSVNENITKSGKRIWVAWTNKVVKDEETGEVEVLSIGSDITERCLIEEAQKRRAGMNSLLADLSSQFVRLDPSEFDEGIEQGLAAIGQFCNVGRSYLFQFDYQQKVMVNTHEWCAADVPCQIHMFQAVPFEGFSWWMESLKEAAFLRITNIDDIPEDAAAIRALFKDNGIKAILAVPLVSGSRRFGFVGMDAVEGPVDWSDIDISLLQFTGELFTHAIERRNALSELTATREQFQTVLDSLDAVVYVADMAAHELLYLNRKGVELFGPIGDHTTCWRHLHKEQTGPCQLCDNTSQSAGDVQVRVYRDPVNNRWYECRDCAIPWPDGRLVHLAVASDITERRQMESHLHQSEKMEAIGQLAGGIAHDFNNQLSVIMGYAQMLKIKFTEECPEREAAERIVTASMRSSDLTKQLLAFSRKGDFVPKPIDTHALIHETMDLLRRSIGKRISLEAHLDAQKTMAEGDSSLLQNALLNLAINSRDAITDNGTITFRTELSFLGHSFSAMQSLDVEPGTYIHISIADTGSGMSEAVQKRMFEPFYTTKESGKGTGMGLASVYGTIKAHGGYITCRSVPEQGTTFNIYLPLAEKGKEETASGTRTIHRADSKAHILLVDDERMVAEMGSTMLKSLGYGVDTFTDSKAALNHFQANAGSYSLVVMDMLMPEMNGLELFAGIQKVRPDMPVLIISGYSDNEDLQAVMADGALGLISKPFDYAQLSRDVAKALKQIEQG